MPAEQILLWAFCSLLAIWALFYAYAKRKLSYWKRRGVKSPKTNIIFGNFLDVFAMRKSPGEVLQSIYEAADPGDPYIGFYVFHKPMLMLRDLELIKRVLVKDFEVFPDRQFGGEMGIDSVGLVNLLGVRKPRWKYLRTKMTPLMTGVKLRAMLPLMMKCGTPLLEHLENLENLEDGSREAELKDLCARYTTDVFWSIIFGVTTNSFAAKNVRFYEAGQKILSGFKRSIILFVMFFVPELVPYIEPYMKKPAEFFRTVFWDSINTREKQDFKNGDLIDSFIALKNEEENSVFKFEGDNLLAQAVAFYIAGFEASSTAIAFTLYKLAQHPEYEKKVYKEIQENFTNEKWTIDLINSMEFLDRVVKESLRLYPPLPVVDRVSIREYCVPGHNLKLEKGTPVYVSLNGTNKDPRFFSDPTKFDPLRERNAIETETSVNSFAFGVGPRSCIGKRIGETLTKVGVVTILQKYEIYREQGEDAIMNSMSVFTAAADGVRVKLRKRI